MEKYAELSVSPVYYMLLQAAGEETHVTALKMEVGILVRLEKLL
jgi:hypothetical protein